MTIKKTTATRQKTGGGTRKGVPNKINKALKDMILGALEDCGGQTYLAKQAKENPAAFMTLLGKTMPKAVELTGEDGGAIKTVTKIELVPFGYDG